MSTQIRSAPAAQSLRVQSGDVELAVKVYGEEGKPVVVLVHGYPDSSHVWNKVVTPLSARYRVVAYDVRGAGESTAQVHTKAYELEHLVADLAAVIDTVSPRGDPVDAIGFLPRTKVEVAGRAVMVLRSRS